MTEIHASAPEPNQAPRSTAPNILQDTASTQPALSAPTQLPSHQELQQSQQRPELDHVELERARALNEQALKDSREGVWYLKEITFDGKKKKIVTQNYNGPCSFIAICNILILRGDIEVLPPERTSVSYEFLAQLVGEYLLRASPDVDLSAALTMMPLTQKGMDLNPLFTSPTAFHPHGDNGALKLFEQANIPLVHGWLVDPHSPEHPAIARIGDYDAAVVLVVEADTLAKGQLVYDENAPGPSGSSGSGSGGAEAGPGPSSSHAYANHPHVHISDNWSAEDKRKVEDALFVQRFLDSTSSQLTYHGLFTLASSIKPGSLVALFRNSHLSVLHRRSIPPPSPSPPAETEPTTTTTPPSSQAPAPTPPATPPPNPSPEQPHSQPKDADSSLYILVTDYIFHNEPSVVWERLEDVDGSSSTFVDSSFRRSVPFGGDFAGAVAASHPAQHHHAAALNGSGGLDDEGKAELYANVDPLDQELARILQAEEDAHAQEAYARRQAQHQQQSQHRQPQPQPQPQRQTPSSNRWFTRPRQQTQQQVLMERGLDPRDPRYAAYVEQQEYVRQQQQQQPQGQRQEVQGQVQEQGQGQGGGSGKPFHKLKRKTSCVIM